MPVYYDSMDLSAAEKQRFFIGAAAIGMTAGLLFYDSPIIGIVITLCSGLFLSKYKMMMTEKIMTRKMMTRRIMTRKIMTRKIMTRG